MGLFSRNRDISQFFEVLPDRKVFMDYYRAIERPISLREIEVSSRMMVRRASCERQLMSGLGRNAWWPDITSAKSSFTTMSS